MHLTGLLNFCTSGLLHFWTSGLLYFLFFIGITPSVYLLPNCPPPLKLDECELLLPDERVDGALIEPPPKLDPPALWLPKLLLLELLDGAE